MNAKEIETLAMIAGVGAAAMASDPQRHPHGTGQSRIGAKRYRRQRDHKRRVAKAAKKRNRR